MIHRLPLLENVSLTISPIPQGPGKGLLFSLRECMPPPLLFSSRDKAGLFDKICSTRDSVLTKRKRAWGIMEHKIAWHSERAFVFEGYRACPILAPLLDPQDGHYLNTCQVEYVLSSLDSSSLHPDSWLEGLLLFTCSNSASCQGTHLFLK